MLAGQRFTSAALARHYFAYTPRLGLVPGPGRSSRSHASYSPGPAYHAVYHLLRNLVQGVRRSPLDRNPRQGAEVEVEAEAEDEVEEEEEVGAGAEAEAVAVAEAEADIPVRELGDGVQEVLEQEEGVEVVAGSQELDRKSVV